MAARMSTDLMEHVLAHLFNDVIERPDGLFHGSRDVGPVSKDDVEVVDLVPLERCLSCFHNVLSTEAPAHSNNAAPKPSPSVVQPC
jgi:hypothetical protein